MDSMSATLKQLVCQWNTNQIHLIRAREPELFHNALYPLIQEEGYKSVYWGADVIDRNLFSRVSSIRPIIDIDGLIKLLKVPELSPQEDREAIIHQGFQMDK